MAERVLAEEVQKVLNDVTFDVALAIQIAESFVTDQLLGKNLSVSMLKNIELFLAAHFASVMATDGTLSSQAVGKANEHYHNIYGPGLSATRYGQQAITLDTTGTLAQISAQAGKPTKFAQFTVVGSNPANEESL